MDLILMSFMLVMTVMQSISDEEFCQTSRETQITGAFSYLNYIFLTRNQYFWVYNTKSFENKVSEPSDKLINLFPELSMDSLASGFTVESIPSCEKSVANNKEKCKFNDHMLGQTFVFYNKLNGMKGQVYSMVKFSQREHVFKYDDSIGGFAFELRTNRSFWRSCWPGRGPKYSKARADNYSATVFNANNNQLLLIGGFNATTNSSLFYKKSLTDQWDQRANDSSVSKEFRGAFSKERILYAVVQESNSKQIVYQYKGSNFFNSGKTIGEFFGCAKYDTK